MNHINRGFKGKIRKGEGTQCLRGRVKNSIPLLKMRVRESETEVEVAWI